MNVLTTPRISFDQNSSRISLTPTISLISQIIYLLPNLIPFFCLKSLEKLSFHSHILNLLASSLKSFTFSKLSSAFLCYIPTLFLSKNDFLIWLSEYLSDSVVSVVTSFNYSFNSVLHAGISDLIFSGTFLVWLFSPVVSSPPRPFEPPHDKTNKMTVHPANTQISLGIRPVWSVFSARSMGSSGPKLSSCGQRRLWSDWVDAQADLSLRWVHMPFCWFCHEAAHFACLSVVKGHTYMPCTKTNVSFGST